MSTAQRGASFWQDYYELHQKRLLEEMRELVDRDSYSRDKEMTNRLGDYLTERMGELGATVERIPLEGCGDLLIGRWSQDAAPSQVSDNKPLLVIGHYDTVWPTGEAGKRPFEIRDGKAFGPGIYDMKGGIALALHVIEGLHAQSQLPKRPLTFLINADEELGSVFSDRIIQHEAEQCEVALVVEPSPSPEVVWTSRRGTGVFEVSIRGQPAHSGANPGDGVSAVEEMAQQILRLHALTDPDQDIHVNVGVVSGGIARNVVAPTASALVDLRYRDPQDGKRTAASIKSVKPCHPGAEITVSGGLRRPAMPRTSGNAKLFKIAQGIGKDLGVTLREQASGAASDGNFVASVGVPTLDGLGVIGSGAHMYEEQVDTRWLSFRAALLTGLLLSI